MLYLPEYDYGRQHRQLSVWAASDERIASWVRLDMLRPAFLAFSARSSGRYTLTRDMRIAHTRSRSDRRAARSQQNPDARRHKKHQRPGHMYQDNKPLPR